MTEVLKKEGATAAMGFQYSSTPRRFYTHLEQVFFYIPQQLFFFIIFTSIPAHKNVIENLAL
jgi:hypothetical protein